MQTGGWDERARVEESRGGSEALTKPTAMFNGVDEAKSAIRPLTCAYHVPTRLARALLERLALDTRVTPYSRTVLKQLY